MTRASPTKLYPPPPFIMPCHVLSCPVLSHEISPWSCSVLHPRCSFHDITTRINIHHPRSRYLPFEHHPPPSVDPGSSQVPADPSLSPAPARSSLWTSPALTARAAPQTAQEVDAPLPLPEWTRALPMIGDVNLFLKGEPPVYSRSRTRTEVKVEEGTGMCCRSLRSLWYMC